MRSFLEIQMLQQSKILKFIKKGVLGFEILNFQEDVCLIRYLQTYNPPASISKMTVQKEML